LSLDRIWWQASRPSSIFRREVPYRTRWAGDWMCRTAAVAPEGAIWSPSSLS